MTTKSPALRAAKRRAAKAKSVFQRNAAKLERLCKHMDILQVEINRLKTQTRALLAQMKAA